MRALPGRLSGHGVTPIRTQGFLFLRPMRAASCAGYSISATSSPQCCRTDASHPASDGLIWPKDGCASIACAATAAVRLSSPGLRPFLARQESLTAAILRCASARRWVRRRSSSACRSPSRPRWSRARTSRRSDMASIGTFKKSGHEYQGEIVTLSVQTKGVRIVPETNRASGNAPSHRVYVGRAEIGAAWSKRSSEGRDYLSVKLDDPSFTAPIYANLVEDGEAFTLIWSRSRKQFVSGTFGGKKAINTLINATARAVKEGR